MEWVNTLSLGISLGPLYLLHFASYGFIKIIRIRLFRRRIEKYGKKIQNSVSLYQLLKADKTRRMNKVSPLNYRRLRILVIGRMPQFWDCIKRHYSVSTYLSSLTVNWKSFIGIIGPYKIDSRFSAAGKSQKVPMWAVDRKEVSIFFSFAFVRPMYFV